MISLTLEEELGEAVNLLLRELPLWMKIRFSSSDEKGRGNTKKEESEKRVMIRKVIKQLEKAQGFDQKLMS